MSGYLKINILTPTMETQNVRGFLSPIIINDNLLRDLGLKIKLFHKIDESIHDCDCLMINAKFFGKDWNYRPDYVIDWLDKFKKSKIKLFYCDNYDSTAPIKKEVLPYIDFYLKNMLLKDRALYKNIFYGGRIHTDFYNRQFGINDKNILYSDSIPEEDYTNKIKVSWNYGLANYGFVGRRIAGLYAKLPFKFFLNSPQFFQKPEKLRSNDVFCRISTNYSRETVAFHRLLLKKKLEENFDIGKVSIYKYIQEIKNSKIVISPFGWGEFSLRDFETFISGGILIKPDMEHLETYPNFYIPNETFIPFKWDFSDINEIIHDTISNYKYRIDIAKNAQEKYRFHLNSIDARKEFSMRFYKIIKSKN